jgi:integrase/recombinase XerD
LGLAIVVVLPPSALTAQLHVPNEYLLKRQGGLMDASAEIYGYERTLDWIMSRVRNSNLIDINKELIEKFSRYLFAEGLSFGRTIKYLIEIRRLAELVNKSFLEARKQDYTEWTKHDYKLALKKFFKFLKGTEDYPEEVRWIKLTISRNNHLLPEELLTEDEVKRMAEVARHPRDKALVLVLYESGCRIGEVLSLKMRNIEFDEYGAVLTVKGKTGMRRVRIIASSPALATWISNHPLRDNRDVYLWISLGTRDRDHLLTYRGLADILKRIALQAGIKKRIYPHLFRHSRATHLANHLTEAQLKQHFGWVQGSDMASTYVHLSGRDVDKALLELNGISVEKAGKEPTFRAILCPRCKNRNSPESNFCNSCGLALDLKAAMELDEIVTWEDKMMDQLTKRPETARLIKNIVTATILSQK